VALRMIGRNEFESAFAFGKEATLVSGRFTPEANTVESSVG